MILIVQNNILKACVTLFMSLWQDQGEWPRKNLR